MIDTKDRIHKAIWSLIGHQNFSKVKVADIAKEANIGKSTVYEYFKDKDAAVFSAITSFCDYLVDHYEKGVEPADNFDSAFTSLCQNTLDVLNKYGDVLANAIRTIGKINFKDASSSTEKMKEKYRSRIDLIIQKAIDDKIITAPNSETSIQFAMNFVFTQTAYYYQNHDSIDLTKTEYIEAMKSTFIKILK